MINQLKKDQLEGIAALRRALKGNPDSALTNQESEENIKRNLVGIFSVDDTAPKSSSGSDRIYGSGLRVTTNGFILTAYHNIQRINWYGLRNGIPETQENFDSWSSRMRECYYALDQEGERCPIDPSFLATAPHWDIALIKIIKNKRPEPVKFRVVNEPLQVGEKVRLLGLLDNAIYNQLGEVTHTCCDVKLDNQTRETAQDTFLTNAQAAPGVSGGVFTDLQGRYAGLATYMAQDNLSGGAKVKNIVQLIDRAAERLAKG